MGKDFTMGELKKEIKILNIRFYNKLGILSCQYYIHL